MRSVGIHLCLSYQCKVNFVCCLITAYMYLCFVYDALRIKVVAGTLMVVETEIFYFFLKITHWWHCSLFFGGFQVLALSLLCYAALRWALLNCDSEDISLISKRWQHELNILILEIVFKTSDGMWCVCECGISFFSYWWHNYCLPCIFLRNSSSFVQNFDYSSLMGPFWHFAFTPNPDIIIVNSSTTSSLFVGVVVGVFDNQTNAKSHIFTSQCLSSAKE